MVGFTRRGILAPFTMTLLLLLPAVALAEQGPLKLKGQLGAIRVMDMSADGQYLLAGSGIEIKLWDLTTGKSRWGLEGSFDISPLGGTPEPLQFSPDGKLVGICIEPELSFANNQDNFFGRVIQIHDTKTGRKLQEFRTTRSRLPFAFTPDSQSIALLDPKGNLGLWNLTTGKKQHDFQGADRCQGLSFSPDSKLLAVSRLLIPQGAPANGQLANQVPGSEVVVWNVANGKQLYKISLQGAGARPVFSPDNQLIAVQSNANLRQLNVGIHQASDGTLKNTFEKIWGSKLQFTPENDQLISVMHEGSSHIVIKVCDLTTGETQQTLHRINGTGLRDVPLSAAGSLLAACDQTSVIELFQPLTGKLLETLRIPPRDRIESIALATDGSRLAVGTTGEMIYYWDLDESPADEVADDNQSPAAGEAVAPMPQPTEPMLRTWTSADGRFTLQAMLADDRDRNVLLQTKDGQEVEVPLAKLSDEDQQYMTEYRQQQNPAGDSSEQAPAVGAKPVVWQMKESSFQGKLLWDMTGVSVLFEGIPMQPGSTSFGQMLVDGPGSTSGDGVIGTGQNRITKHSAYAAGVSTFKLRYKQQEQVIELKQGGKQLVINGKHEFDLSKGRKAIVVKADGTAKEK